MVYAYLNRAEFSEVKHICSFWNTTNKSSHLTAGLGVPYTGSNLSPVTITGHALLQPTRVVLQVIVHISSVLHDPTRTFVRHHVGEDDEADEDGDDEEHDEEIKPHQKSVPVARAGETGERDDHDGSSDDDERPLEELEAVCVVCSAA